MHAPGADTAAVIKAGATSFRKIVKPTDLGGAVVAYSNSVDRVFYLVAALVTVSGIFIWGIGWQDLRKKVEDVSSDSKEFPVENDK